MSLQCCSQVAVHEPPHLVGGLWELVEVQHVWGGRVEVRGPLTPVRVSKGRREWGQCGLSFCACKAGRRCVPVCSVNNVSGCALGMVRSAPSQSA